MSETWAEAARLRQGLYRFAAGALLPPTESTIDTLRNAASYLSAFDIAGYAFYPQWESMAEAIDVAEFERVSRDYVRLFASGTDMALCPPVESFFLSDVAGAASGEVGAAVTRLTRSLGLAATDSIVPPDHAASELEVMSALCARESAAWTAQSGPEAIGRLGDEELFLSTHPARWLPAFARRVREVGAGPPYAAVAEFAHAFTVHDLDYIRAACRYFEGAA